MPQAQLWTGAGAEGGWGSGPGPEEGVAEEEAAEEAGMGALVTAMGSRRRRPLWCGPLRRSPSGRRRRSVASRAAGFGRGTVGSGPRGGVEAWQWTGLL